MSMLRSQPAVKGQEEDTASFFKGSDETSVNNILINNKKSTDEIMMVSCRLKHSIHTVLKEKG